MGTGTYGSTDKVSSQLAVRPNGRPGGWGRSHFGIRPNGSAFTEELGITKQRDDPGLRPGHAYGWERYLCV